MAAKSRQREIPDGLLRQGEQLAQWFNERPKLNLAALAEDLKAYGAACEEWAKKSRRDVGGLRSLLDGLRDQGDGLFDKLWKKSRKWMPDELAALHDRLCERLRRYDTRWLPIPTRGGGVRLGRELLDTKIQLTEARAFDTIARLMEHGLFDRLRRCAHAKCGRWLFAAQRSDQKHCNTECRQSAFEDTPERKEQKRQNAARHYALNYKGARLDRRKKA